MTDITIKDYINKCMEEVKNEVNSIRGDVADIKRDLQTFIANADERYAPKWVADAITWSAVTLILTLLGVIGYLLDKHGL